MYNEDIRCSHVGIVGDLRLLWVMKFVLIFYEVIADIAL